jgi:hypothetical protein
LYLSGEAKPYREAARPESEQLASEEKVSRNQEQNAVRLTELLTREQTVGPYEEPEYSRQWRLSSPRIG